MKILIVNTYHYIRGGDCRLSFGMANLLMKNGHEVFHFAMKGENNYQSSEQKYFVNEIDYQEQIQKYKLNGILRVFGRSIYSFEARNKIIRLLDKRKPDIAHIHSVRHHITTSIFPELFKRNIPIVWTLHDYKELCPNTNFHNGKTICEKCKVAKYHNVILNSCKKNSVPASVATYLEASVNKYLNHKRYVDKYISPSKFLKNKFIEYGYKPEKIQVIQNFIEGGEYRPLYEHENYFLYIGRLEKEKGLKTLILAYAKSLKYNNSSKLLIAGTGSMKTELKKMISSLKIENAHLLGFIKGIELENITRKAKAIVIPSECFENYPFAVLEAMAYGKPVIASRIGGIPELVEDGVTGYLYQPSNPHELALKIKTFNSLSMNEIAKMGKLARNRILCLNNSKLYLKRLIGVYQKLTTR